MSDDVLLEGMSACVERKLLAQPTCDVLHEGICGAKDVGSTHMRPVAKHDVTVAVIEQDGFRLDGQR